MKEEELFYWAAPKSDPDMMEPAAVEFRDGQPFQLWFTGNDVPFDADQCIIGEPITRGK